MTQSRTTSLDGGIATTVLGRTGLRVSRAAFGGLDTLDQAGFERGVELGVNFLISFPGYPREQRAIGRAARRVDRDAIVLAAGTAGRSASSVRRDLKRSLVALRTDHVDIFYLFHVTCDAWPTILSANGAMAQLDRARRAGQVRAVGVTVHNRQLARRIVASGTVDVMNVRYSLAHPGHEANVLPEAAAAGCGVVVYSALKYGALVTRPEGWPARRRIATPSECYRFVLGHPAVHVAWAGARNARHVEGNVEAIRPFVRLHHQTERALRRYGQFVHDATPVRPPSARTARFRPTHRGSADGSVSR